MWALRGRSGSFRNQGGMTLQGNEHHAVQQLQLMPPVLRRYVERLCECAADCRLTPQVFHDMLNDEEFFRDVSGPYNKKFGDVIKAIAGKWWSTRMKDILQRRSSSSDGGVTDGAGVAADEEVREGPSSSNQVATRSYSDDVSCDEVCRDLRAVLLVAVVACSPYSVVRGPETPVITCTTRVMLCGDPSIIYLGLLINVVQSSQAEKSLDSGIVLRTLAYGWGSSPTFEDVVKCSLRARRRNQRRLAVANEEGEAGASATRCEEDEAEEAADVALLQLPGLASDPLQIAPERIPNQCPPGMSSYVAESLHIGRCVLESMKEAAGNPERLLWWSRCRLLCIQLLSSGDCEELLAGPACDFFRSLWSVERLFADILDLAEHDDDGEESDACYGGVGRSSGVGSAPTVAALVGTIADVVRAWHKAESGAGAMQSIVANHTGRNPLETVNRVVPGHRKFQQRSHRCLSRDWQYRLVVHYHSTHLAGFPHPNSSYTTMVPVMVAQLTDVLRRHPRYSPIQLMYALALTRESTNTSVAMNSGLVSAVVTVMKVHMDEKQECDGDGSASNEGKGTRYGWSYRTIAVLYWCFMVLEQLTTLSTHESVNPIVFLLSPREEDGYELCRHISEKIFFPGGHPALLVAAFRFFAACIHHNVRDVVPALQQRGLLETLLRIVGNTEMMEKYNCFRGDESVEEEGEGEAQQPSQGQPPTTSGVEGCSGEAPITCSEYSAYYEQAIPIVCMCGILQAFAVHNSTHAFLADRMLMRRFMWSLTVPYLPEAAGPVSSPPAASAIAMRCQWMLGPQRVSTKLAASAGLELLVLIRTLPQLQDYFFQALEETLKSLEAEAKRGGTPMRDVRLSMWNIFACLGDIEYKHLAQRGSNRRGRQQRGEHSSETVDALLDKFKSCSKVLASSLSTLLRLSSTAYFGNPVSLLRNGNVLTSNLFDAQCMMFESLSREVIQFASEIARDALQEGNNGVLTEAQAGALWSLFLVFFSRESYGSSPPSGTVNFRRDLANVIFDAFVALEMATNTRMPLKSVATPAPSRAAATVSQTSSRLAHGPATIPYTSNDEFVRSVFADVSLFVGSPTAPSITIQSSTSDPLNFLAAVVDETVSVGATFGVRSIGAADEDSERGSLETCGAVDSGPPSSLERFRNDVLRFFTSAPGRNRCMLPLYHAFYLEGGSPPCPQMSIPAHMMVTPSHVLGSVCELLRKVGELVSAATKEHQTDGEVKDEDGACETEQQSLKAWHKGSYSSAALHALNLVHLREAEMRLQVGETALTSTWKHASEGPNVAGSLCSIVDSMSQITGSLFPSPDLKLLREPPSSSVFGDDVCHRRGYGNATGVRDTVEAGNTKADGARGAGQTSEEAKLEVVVGHLTGILEALLKLPPERGSQRSFWQPRLLFFVLIMWRSRGFKLSAETIVGALSHLAVLGNEIFELGGDAFERNGAVASSLGARGSDAEAGVTSEYRTPSIQDSLPTRESGRPNQGEGDGNTGVTAQEYLEATVGDVPPPIYVPSQSLRQFLLDEFQRPRVSNPARARLAILPRDARERGHLSAGLLAAYAPLWVLEVAATMRSADASLGQMWLQTRRLCSKLCWIYHMHAPCLSVGPTGMGGDQSRGGISMIEGIIRLVLEKPTRNHTLLEFLSVILSQYESITLREELVTRTQLPRAILDCITKELKAIENEPIEDVSKKREEWSLRHSMLGQLFCFLSSCSVGTLAERGSGACSHYRGSSTNFCMMGHLCCNPHVGDKAAVHTKQSTSKLSRPTRHILRLLEEFGYKGDPSTSATAEVEVVTSAGPSVSRRSAGHTARGAEASATDPVDDAEDDGDGRVHRREDTASETSCLKKHVDVKLSLSSVVGGTSSLPKSMLLDCAVLTLQYLANDADANELRTREPMGREDGRNISLHTPRQGGRGPCKRDGVMCILGTPIISIAVRLLIQLLDAGDSTLLSHIYHLNETTNKGFVTRAVSRLLGEDVLPVPGCEHALKALVDQSDHTEWVVYSAMVSAVHNCIRAGVTALLRESDVREMHAGTTHSGGRRPVIPRGGGGDVYRHSVPMDEFITSLRTVIDKHPKAFCAVFNSWCIVHIVSMRGNSRGDNRSAVLLVPRKPPRLHVAGNSPSPQRLTLEYLLDTLLSRFARKQLPPLFVAAVLNKITTLPAVASIVTTYSVNVPVPPSMRSAFLERKAKESEQPSGCKVEGGDTCLLPDAGPRPLTPFLAVLLFVEESVMERFEPFLSNVAQKAPSRTAHIILQALDVTLTALASDKASGANSITTVSEEAGNTDCSSNKPSPSTMARSLLHALRLLLVVTSSSLVWRLCEELCQRGALELLYRTVQKKCCSTERDAATLILVIRRLLLAHSKCAGLSGEGVGQTLEQAGVADGVGGAEPSAGVQSTESAGTHSDPTRHQLGLLQQPNGAEEDEGGTRAPAPQLGREEGQGQSHDSASLLRDSTQRPQQQHFLQSGSVDDFFYLNALVNGNDSRREASGSNIRRRRSFREEAFSDFLLGLGELLQPNHDIATFESHNTSDGTHNEDESDGTADGEIAMRSPILTGERGVNVRVRGLLSPRNIVGGGDGQNEENEGNPGLEDGSEDEFGTVVVDEDDLGGNNDGGSPDDDDDEGADMDFNDTDDDDDDGDEGVPNLDSEYYDDDMERGSSSFSFHNRYLPGGFFGAGGRQPPFEPFAMGNGHRADQRTASMEAWDFISTRRHRARLEELYLYGEGWPMPDSHSDPEDFLRVLAHERREGADHICHALSGSGRHSSTSRLVNICSIVNMEVREQWSTVDSIRPQLPITNERSEAPPDSGAPPPTTGTAIDPSTNEATALHVVADDTVFAASSAGALPQPSELGCGEEQQQQGGSEGVTEVTTVAEAGVTNATGESEEERPFSSERNISMEAHSALETLAGGVQPGRAPRNADDQSTALQAASTSEVSGAVAITVAGSVDADVSTLTAAPTDAVAELPMEEQPWFEVIHPHFLLELPETLRRELLFDHMNVLLGEVTRRLGEHRTRIFAAFFTQLPADVQQEALEVEQRWLQVTGDAPTSGGEGQPDHSVLIDLLSSLDSELRQEILATCDVGDLAEYPELLQEANRVRQSRAMEVVNEGDVTLLRRLRRHEGSLQALHERRAAENFNLDVAASVLAAETSTFTRGAPRIPSTFRRSQALGEVGPQFHWNSSLPRNPNSVVDIDHLRGLGRRHLSRAHDGSSDDYTVGRRSHISRDAAFITEAHLLSCMRSQQNRAGRDERMTPPPPPRTGAAVAEGVVPAVPCEVLKQLVEFIWLSKGPCSPIDRPGSSSTDLSVGPQLVQLLVTACVDAETAAGAMLYLVDAVLKRIPKTPPSPSCICVVSEASVVSSVVAPDPCPRPSGALVTSTGDASTAPSVSVDAIRDYGRVALGTLYVITQLIERCRAAGLSLTTLPDTVFEGSQYNVFDGPIKTEEEIAVSRLFKKLVELVSRVPLPRVEVAFTRVVSSLNQQLRRLEETAPVAERVPPEVDRESPGDNVIRHPRHPHPLRWQGLHRYSHADGGYVCNRCNTVFHAEVVTFRCEPCGFDICPGCSFVSLTVEEEVKRGRCWGYAFVSSEGTIDSALRLLRHPNCSDDMAQEVVEFFRRGIKESARRDKTSSESGGSTAIEVIERVIVDLAGSITKEIHECVNALRAAFPLKALKPLLLGGASAEDRVTSGADSQQWTTEEVSVAFSYMSLNFTSNKLIALFLPYSECSRPEPSEISLMWHAVQTYLAEVAFILEHMQNCSTVLLPQAVLLLLSAFCQFHMAEPRRGAATSATSESMTSVYLEKTDTERFMLDSTHSPSTVSDVADMAVRQSNTEQQQQQRRNSHREVASGGATDGDGVHDERQAIPRVVRQFVERNKPTINTLIQYDPKVLEGTFKFLRSEPGFVDFNIRLNDFHRQISYTSQGPRISLSINRGQCLRDSFAQLSKLSNFHGSISVRFSGEEGTDAGGLTREWFQLIAEEMVNDNYALFIHSCEGMTYQPNPLSGVNSLHLQYFRFCGIVVGMAVAHRVAIDVHFTRSVYRHMIGVQPTFGDLKSVDPELYENLKWLLENDVSDLGLFFTVSCEKFGVTEEVELVPNGSQVAVTNANKTQYVRLRCEFCMTRQIEEQLQEFLKGFYTVIPRKEIRNFSAQELELVICGMPDIDVEDLRLHTSYDGYTSTSPQIRWFWEVVASMTKEDRANLLQFATGASRVPHGGFSNLESSGGTPQRFTISRWAGSAELLPQAHTCFNKIALPEYGSCEELRRKLMVAITFGSRGFTMT